MPVFNRTTPQLGHFAHVSLLLLGESGPRGLSTNNLARDRKKSTRTICDLMLWSRWQLGAA
jgi:hypothetical protein